MKKIAEINLEECSQSEIKNFSTREAVRAVIIDEQGMIALVYVARDSYYKIPGGGIDEGEDNITALQRECFEEAGVEISDIKGLGFTIEYRKIWNQTQTSFCYTAMVQGKKSIPEYTETEREKSFKISWVNVETALEKMRTHEPKNLGEQYMAKRDLMIVEEYYASLIKK